MVRNVKVACVQMSYAGSRDATIEKAERFVREAAAKGAQIVLLQELFETPYFCQDQFESFFAEARPASLENPTLARFSAVAKELRVVLPISFFERANNAHYNSVVVIDADGTLMGTYRKSHIPDGPGYQEKYYFNPGDTGFKVWKTQYGIIGIGICWDQWFPECARSMALQGAELLFYPTAIGSEPHSAEINSRLHWQRVMQGHAGANVTPVICCNRIGKETAAQSDITFYGWSFIADQTGGIMAQADQTEETILYADFELDALRSQRAAWGVFRDRRPELYWPLMTLDGENVHQAFSKRM